MTRQWQTTSKKLPNEGQKIYYFCDFLGIFRGEYHFSKNSYGSPHKFISKHGILDSDDVSHWMTYDHSLKDMVPLPPDYIKADINRNSQSLINSGEDMIDNYELPQQQRQFNFTYITAGDI